MSPVAACQRSLRLNCCIRCLTSLSGTTARPHCSHMENVEAIGPHIELSGGQPRSGPDRRDFLVKSLTGCAGLALWSGQAVEAFARGRRSGGDPLCRIRTDHFDTLCAFFEAQLCSLWEGMPADHPVNVTNDAIDFVSCLPPRLHEGLDDVLAWLDFYSLVHTRRKFSRLRVDERWSLLNQGETPGGRYVGKPSLILWEDDFPLHAAISGLALLGRLVINSRQPAQKHI